MKYCPYCGKELPKDRSFVSRAERAREWLKENESGLTDWDKLSDWRIIEIYESLFVDKLLFGKERDDG